MSYQIEVDDDVMGFLKRNAEPFSDTPNSVLRRLLLDGPRPTGKPIEPAQTPRLVPIRRTTPKARTRAASGSLLPEEEYVQPLLEYLEASGGRAPFREIVVAMESALGGRLTKTDRETLSSGGIRWHTRLQFVRIRLVERGLVAKDSPRGIWELTKEGSRTARQGLEH